MNRKNSKNYVLALIPARSKSQRIKNKNLQKIDNQTLVEITIAQAIKSQIFNEVIVSSNSKTILNLAEKSGSLIIPRPEAASNERSTANDVVRHFISWAEKNLDEFSKNTIIVYLQPTSPFRNKNLISDCLRLFLKSSTALVVVTRVKQHPMKMLKINNKNRLVPLSKKSNPTANWQSLPNIFIPTGSIYIFTVSEFLARGEIPVSHARPYLVDGLDSIDIDDKMDLEIAKKLWIEA